MQHVQTGYVPSYSRSFDQRWKLGNAIHASSHLLWRNAHLSGTETAKMAWSSGRISICHDCRSQWPSNGSHLRQSKHSVHSLKYGVLITGSRIGGASCAHACLQLGFGITIVPVQDSWHGLGNAIEFWLCEPQGDQKWWQWTGYTIMNGRAMYQDQRLGRRRVLKEAVVSQIFKYLEKLHWTIYWPVSRSSGHSS